MLVAQVESGRGWIATLALAVILATGISCTVAPKELDLSGHNLLLITIDTLRADRLGCYGFARAETPHLDRLASNGVRFESCYSPVPLTLPSHSAMFTGRYPWVTGVRLNGTHFLDDAETTLAEVLRSNGFRTSATIASYVLTAKFGLSQGFDVYDDSLRMDDLFRFYSEIPADEVFQRFKSWYGAGEPGRFFSWIHFYDPHLPYEPPPEYLQRFADDPYSGEIAFVDTYVGKVLNELRDTGVLDRTLVVVASDHGEAFGEHREEGHGLLCYDETLRVPLIFSAPGKLKAGTVIRERVQLMDLMPTLLELLGVEAPAALNGRSFVALFRGEERPHRRAIYFESLAGHEAKSWAPLSGIIVDDHKYISLPEPELYDLSDDPHETNNLSPAQPAIVRRLSEDLETLVLSTKTVRAESRRELSEEDVRHLRALGYVSASLRSPNQRLDPKQGIDIEMRLRGVRTLIERDDIEQGERMLDTVISEISSLEMPDLYLLRHDIAAARRSQEAAITALQEGISRFPELEALRFSLATYFFELQRYEEAEALCRALLAKNPTLSQALSLLGLVAEKRKDWQQALELYRQALQIEPRSIPLQAKMADALVQVGEAEEALKIYNRLVDAGAFDQDADHLYKAAMLSHRFGSLERAEQLFRRGLELKPGGAHYLSFALVLSRSNKMEEAIRNLEIALRQYGDQLTPEQVSLARLTLEQWRR